ncbi:MAG: hypothetical protein ABI472_03455 [Ginsengibacter sp.]
MFVDHLGFKVKYKEIDPQPFYIIERDLVTLFLVEDDEYAKKDRPEIRIDTDDIETLHSEIEAKNTKLFHPNLPKVQVQPWGLKEFALLDKSGVCIIVQQAT